MAKVKKEKKEINPIFKNMDIDFIIKWCQEHNEMAWLEAEVNRKVEVKRYPRKKVQAFDKKTGEPLYTEKGNIKYVSVADKTQPPVTVEEDIGFIQIKMDFCEKFMKDIMPVPDAKEPTMRDKLKAAIAAN